jgi:selenophosphate synthase
MERHDPLTEERKETKKIYLSMQEEERNKLLKRMTQAQILISKSENKIHKLKQELEEEEIIYEVLENSRQRYLGEINMANDNIKRAEIELKGMR